MSKKMKPVAIHMSLQDSADLVLNIHEDDELRQQVRELVRGQVDTVIHGEIRSMIIEAIAGEGAKLTAKMIENMVQTAISNHVRAVVNENSYGDDHKKLEKMIRVMVIEMLKGQEGYAKSQIDKFVSDLTFDELNSQIAVHVREEAKNIVANVLSK